MLSPISHIGNHWHRLIEQYTPDGTLVRVLLAIVSGFSGGLAFDLAIVGLSTSNFFLSLFAPVAIFISLTVTIFTITILWPIYLSLIGEIESVDAYPSGDAAPVPHKNGEPDTAIEMLKRRYAAGDISENEFERRIENLLQRDSTGQNITDGRENPEQEREYEL